MNDLMEFAIYEYTADVDPIDWFRIPHDLPYNIYGFKKKKIYNKGELVETIYYGEYNEITKKYSKPIVKESREFFRENTFVQKRKMTINWYYIDGTLCDYSKTTWKYYDSNEQINENKTRRTNIVNNLQLSYIGLLIEIKNLEPDIALTEGKSYLGTLVNEITAYVEGVQVLLIDNITNDNSNDFLEEAVAPGIKVRDYLLNELII